MSVVGDLRKSLGEDKVVVDADILRIYARDPASLEYELPLAVVYAESVEDVVQVVRYAIDHKLYITPVFHSSSLSGNAATIAQRTIVLSSEKMNKILEVSEVDWLATVQPGIKIDEFNLELMRYGLQWPVDPASSKTASVGGSIINGGGGMRGAKYGPASHWVLGLQAVIGTGEVIRVGCRTLKCREGYDLLHLFVGSEGTLGVITEATVRLAPLPESFAGVVAQFEDAASLAKAVVESRRRRLWLLVAEFMDDEGSEFVGLERKYTLWLGVDATVGSEDALLSRLKDIVDKTGGRVNAEARDWNTFFKLLGPRRLLYPAPVKKAVEQYGGSAIILMGDVAVPFSRLPEALEDMKTIAKSYGVPTIFGGHVGDGNIHPVLWFNRSDEAQKRRATELYERFGEIALKYGGTVSAEHGIGLHKKELLKKTYEMRNSQAVLRLFKEIKRIFDPYGIFNPGKIID
ncbi:FAD-binding oxidoreductase [Thermoproteus tenax]|uniref:D-lactate dehydrogenase (cytochrome) n=1 Tax=Thermoproteus tenax (strain ATCC 35583 / DSM 2078 / JCM 9277 / NBRC 100435 / Kra 1) TaxID=768679 RepID=G4RK59_THETK|nr:FAD-binding oxidoreductase [Thermoproteus tenax]CCC81954.1 D-lactate dehydrogenase [Thermoproteus tenax Kra 1]